MFIQPIVIGMLSIVAGIAITLGSRIWTNKKDLRSIATGKPYQRRFHISDERTFGNHESFKLSKQSLLEYFQKRHFSIASSQDNLWAISPPYANFPVLVMLTTEPLFKIRILDRDLQPSMHAKLKGRFYKRMTKVLDDIDMIVNRH